MAVFVRNDIYFRVLSTACVSVSDLEALFIKLDCGTIVGVVYRPPNSVVAAFVKKLEASLLLLSRG